jgi:hypothetical protein
MAFLLAIATGKAADRFDARRGLVLQEANSIGTAFAADEGNSRLEKGPCP